MTFNEKISRYFLDDVINIKKFLSTRPEVIGAYCYGMGNYYSRRSYKLVLVTDDIWRWQKENMHCRENTEYSNFLYQKGFDFIEYTGIKEDNFVVDYTLMNCSEFLADLVHWKMISYAEIFQRPFMTIKSIDYLDKLIARNQKSALILSLLKSRNNKTSFFDLMIKLYCISDSISNEKLTTIDDNYCFLKKMYIENPYFELLGNNDIKIDRERLLNDIIYLPNYIKDYITIQGQYIYTDNITNVLSDKKQLEQDEINDMRLLVNGIFKTSSCKARTTKIKAWKRR